MYLNFLVEGTPIPKGSVVPGRRKDGSMFIRPADSRLTAWEKQIASTAAQGWSGPAFDGPVAVTLSFRMPRGKTVTRELPTVKPDLDKLVRAVLDGLTRAAVFIDDAQVIEIQATKCYSPTVGVHVEVRDCG